MALESRKYKDGETVEVKVFNTGFRLIVVSATECLKDWSYRLAYPKKNGEPNKKKSHRVFWQKELSTPKPPQP